MDKTAAWCLDCGGRYSEIEIEGKASCPGCGSAGVPCNPADDLTVEINWHELRVLSIWASNYAHACAERTATNKAMPTTAQAIARRLERQYPDLPALTMGGELRELRQVLACDMPGSTVEVKGGMPERETPVLVNGPGAVGHTPRTRPDAV